MRTIVLISPTRYIFFHSVPIARCIVTVDTNFNVILLWLVTTCCYDLLSYPHGCENDTGVYCMYILINVCMYCQNDCVCRLLCPICDF